MHRARQCRVGHHGSFIGTASAHAVTILVSIAIALLTGHAQAQETNGSTDAVHAATVSLPTSAATSAACPALSATATVAPPKVAASEVGKLPLDRQVRWLTLAAQSGMLANMNDADLVALFKSLDPLTVPRYLKDGPNGYSSYEFTLLRRERINGRWPDQPDHMLVRVTREPRRVYARWLPDGAHAGQEILYDETTRRNEMYGHLGGVLNIITMWTTLDGTLAHTQSRHSIRDLGTEYIAQQFLAEGQKYADLGVTRPNEIEVKTIDGTRVVAFTYESPVGRPDFYAKKEVLGLDLRRPYFRTAESFDNDGKIFESLVFQNIAPKTFDEATFSPKNPDYKF
jgi:hypothetical protein